MRPGTKVFCGDPLIKGTPSKMDAAAKMLDGAISLSSLSMDARKVSAVSFKPSATCADHNMWGKKQVSQQQVTLIMHADIQKQEVLSCGT